MRRYETTVIVDPDLSEEDRTALFDRVKEIIVQQQGVLIEEDFWGTKKLAYEIKKKPRGFYVRYDYCGMGPLVSELERFFRIDDRLMKYLTVLLDSEADVEKIKSEADEAKKPQSEEPTAPAAQAEASAPVEDTAADAAAAPEAAAAAAPEAAAEAAPEAAAEVAPEAAAEAAPEVATEVAKDEPETETKEQQAKEE